MTTAFLYDERFLNHDAGAGHPERKERLEYAIRHLRAQHWFKDLVPVEPKICDRRWIEEIHDSKYVDRASRACQSGLPFLDVPDVGISEKSCDIAYLAAGGALELADRVVSREVQNGSRDA